MSSYKYLTIDSKLLLQLEELPAYGLTPASCDTLVSLGIALMENDNVVAVQEGQVADILSKYNISQENTKIISQILAALFWEVIKTSTKSKSIVSSLLSQVKSLSNDINESLSNAYITHYARLGEIKKNVFMTKNRYDNFSWRLDMEIAKRNMDSTIDPKFMIRLDISNDANDVAASSNGNNINSNITSYNLQSDYANMKRIQIELQRAVNELEGPHSLRIQKYLS